MNGFKMIGGEIYISETKFLECFANMMNLKSERLFFNVDEKSALSCIEPISMFGVELLAHMLTEHAEDTMRQDNKTFIPMLGFARHTLEDLDFPTIIVNRAFLKACSDMGDYVAPDAPADATRMRSSFTSPTLWMRVLRRENLPYLNESSARELGDAIFRQTKFSRMAEVWIRVGPD